MAGLRILWVCGSRIAGGAERATLEVLATLRRRGHTVHTLCPPGSAVPELVAEHDITYTRCGIGNAFSIGAYGAIRRGVGQISAQIALVTTIHEWVWSGLGAARPAALVLARHMDVPLNSRVAALANRRAAAVIAVSDAVRRTLVERSGIAPGLVRVIHNPTRYAPRAEPPAAAERDQARFELGLRGDGHWVGFFGGFDPGKGLEDAMHAVRRANQVVGPVHLFVTRRGHRWRSDAAADQSRLSAGRLGDRLHVTGEAGRMDQALTAVHATVLATRSALGEALPLTAIESLACATPVVAYRVGGIPEVLGENGEAGYLAKPDDPESLAGELIALLQEPQRAAAVARRGLERARQLFAPELIADRYEALFAELAARGRAA